MPSVNMTILQQQVDLSSFASAVESLVSILPSAQLSALSDNITASIPSDQQVTQAGEVEGGGPLLLSSDILDIDGAVSSLSHTNSTVAVGGQNYTQTINTTTATVTFLVDLSLPIDMPPQVAADSADLLTSSSSAGESAVQDIGAALSAVGLEWTGVGFQLTNSSLVPLPGPYTGVLFNYTAGGSSSGSGSSIWSSTVIIGVAAGGGGAVVWLCCCVLLCC